MTMNINRLIHIKLAIPAPPQRMQNMMGILRPEPRQHNFPEVRLAVAINILEVKQFRTICDIRPAIAWLDARWDQQPVRKHRRLIRLAIPIHVLEHDDLIIRLLPWCDLRIDLRRRDPEPPPGVEIHLDRLGQQTGPPRTNSPRTPRPPGTTSARSPGPPAGSETGRAGRGQGSGARGGETHW